MGETGSEGRVKIKILLVASAELFFLQLVVIVVIKVGILMFYVIYKVFLYVNQQ